MTCNLTCLNGRLFNSNVSYINYLFLKIRSLHFTFYMKNTVLCRHTILTVKGWMQVHVVHSIQTFKMHPPPHDLCLHHMVYIRESKFKVSGSKEKDAFGRHSPWKNKKCMPFQKFTWGQPNVNLLNLCKRATFGSLCLPSFSQISRSCSICGK